MKYRIVERFKADSNNHLYYIQYKDFCDTWRYHRKLMSQRSFQESLFLLENYIKPSKVMYEVET